MTLEQAQQLAQQYGLVARGIEPIQHGSVNSNFRLELADGSARFLRVCEESPHDVVEAQNALLTHLATRGVPTPAPIPRRDGSTVSTHVGKPLVAFPFFEGHWACQASVDVRRLGIVGGALAKVHVAGEGYLDAPANRFGADALVQRIASLRSRQLEAGVAQDVEWLAARLVSGPPDETSTTVIHGDVFRDNVLWHGGELAAIVDFESASRGHVSFDLMVTLLAWCYTDRLEQDLARALIGGYLAERPLSPGEREACFEHARAAGVRFAITRITDYELRPRGVVVYKDYRRFVARVRAIEAIGKAAWPAWIGL